MLFGVLYIDWLLFHDRWYFWVSILVVFVAEGFLFWYFFCKLSRPEVEKVKEKLDESLSLILSRKQKRKK